MSGDGGDGGVGDEMVLVLVQVQLGAMFPLLNNEIFCPRSLGGDACGPIPGPSPLCRVNLLSSAGPGSSGSGAPKRVFSWSFNSDSDFQVHLARIPHSTLNQWNSGTD